MFLGKYRAFFTGKNRIILPKKFRAELGREVNFYLVAGLDGELWGFESREWQKEADRRLSVSITEIIGRRERRVFFGMAEEAKLDGQGRFVLSQELVDVAGLQDEVVLLGCGDHFEIWSSVRYEDEMIHA